MGRVRARSPVRHAQRHPQLGYTVRRVRHSLFVLSKVVGCIIKSSLETVRVTGEADKDYSPTKST